MPYNIATFTHSTSLYGANRSLLALIEGSKKQNISFHVLVPDRGAVTEELEERGVPYHVVPFRYWMSAGNGTRDALSRLKTNITSVPTIVAKLKEWGINLIHTNSSVTPIGALCAEVMRCPHVWHIREFGDLDYDLSFDWGPKVSRFLMSRSNARIAVSRAVGSHVCGKMDLPYQVVYNGVLPGHELTAPEPNPTPGKHRSSTFTFAIVGLLHKAKGQRQALKAMHRLKDEGKNARLLVAGSGPDMEKLKHLAKSLEIDQSVHFLGFVSDPFELYRRADALLMCSPNEAMGRVTAEAMMSGCPVIGYNSQGTKEIIGHQKNGLLYGGTVEELYVEMKKLVENLDLAYSLGQKAFEKAKNMYTNEVYAGRVVRVFDRVLHM